MSEFAKGLGYLIAGLRYLLKPRVIPFVILPVLINIAIYYLGFGALYDYFKEWLDGWTDSLPAWLDFIIPFLQFIFFALMTVIIALTFSSVATLIGAPFYGLLAEQVTFLATGEVPDQPLNMKTLLAIAPRTIVRELQKLLYYVPRAIALLLLSILGSVVLPIIQPLVAALWFLFGARMLSIQYVDYAFDNDQKSFRQMRLALKANRRLSLGFGTSTQLALMIPVLSIVFIPAAVCAGTLLYNEKLNR